MCGRFTREYTMQELGAFVEACFPGGVASVDDRETPLEPGYNVAPTQRSPIVQGSGEGDAVAGLIGVRRWGLIPRWADDHSIGHRLINARSETAAEKPAFRGAFASEGGRCVVPVSSFYEWARPANGGAKRPHRVLRADGAVLWLAGLCEPPNEHAPEGTFTILTTPANAFVSRMHDRMPAVLEPEAAAEWCDPRTPKDHARGLLRPAAEGVLDAHPVSRRVNSPRQDDAGLIEAAGDGSPEESAGDSTRGQPGLFG